jgi:hypothetical protein
MFLRLLAPENENQKAIDDIAKIRDYNSESKISLDDEKLSKLKDFIKEKYEEWHKATSDERKHLIKLNKILEGDLPNTTFPFGEENSSQINIKLPSAQFRAFRTLFRRAVFNSRNLFVVKSKNQNEDAAKVGNIEAALNWLSHDETNLVEILKDTDLPCFRDGIALVHGEWVRKIEKGVDFKVYNDNKKFEVDYPDAETAGITQEKYQEILEYLLEPGSDDEISQVQVQYDIDFIKKNEAEFKLFPLVNFVQYPFFVENIKELLIYGFLFTETKSSFLQKIKSNFYNKNAEDLLDKKSSINNNDFTISQNKIEKISPEDENKIELSKLVVTVDLDDDKIPETYRVYYYHEKKEIVRIEKYNIRRNVPDIVGFRFVKRDGRFRGISLLNDVSDLLLEVNALHRHRSNVRRLTDAPIPLVPEGLKEELGDMYTVKPGQPIYIPDKFFANGIVPQQFKLFNVDQTNTSMDEEVLVMKYVETLLGPTQGLSGQIDPSDPRAPGNKTAMLLNQANARVQDYIDEWKRSIPEILDLLVSLYFQNSKSNINFIKNESGTETLENININDFVDNDIKFSLSANAIALSPELEMNKITSLATSYINLGLAQQNPNKMLEFWNRIVIASRIPGFEKFLEQVQQQENNINIRKFAQGLTPGALQQGLQSQDKQLQEQG